MWTALMIAIVVPVLAGILLLGLRLNGGMLDDSGPPYVGL
jgi:hypothetical protein